MPIIQGMNFRYGIFSLVLITALFFSTALFAQERVHTVSAGETIYSIAKNYNVTQDELMRLNEITDPTKLRAGQRLRIPGTNTVTVTATGASGFIYYPVVRGDTFFSLAQTHNTTVDEIRRINNLASNYVLKEGDVLKLPVAGGSAAPAPSSSPPLIAANPEARATASVTLDTSVRWPINARDVSYMSGRVSGVIITGDRSESVKSLTSGTVISAGPHRGYGRVAIVQAPNGYTYVYGGCESLTVKEGDRVGPGMEMGRLGVDAITGVPQLFFHVYLNNTPIDPAKAPRA